MLHQQDAVGPAAVRRPAAALRAGARRALAPRRGAQDARRARAAGPHAARARAARAGRAHQAPRPGRAAARTSWTGPAEVLAGLQHFRHDHHEVVVFHILDPDELDFPYTDSATFVDLESGERLTTEPWEIARRYRERLAAWTAQLPAAVPRAPHRLRPASTRARRSTGRCSRTSRSARGCCERSGLAPPVAARRRPDARLAALARSARRSCSSTSTRWARRRGRARPRATCAP